MITIFRQRWTVHALDIVKVFFGIRIICSSRCVTLDQNDKIHGIICDVFGVNYLKQHPGKGYATPMITGTVYANTLAACTPYSDSEL